MADNIKQYKSVGDLLSLLMDQGLPASVINDVVLKLKDVVAEVLSKQQVTASADPGPSSSKPSTGTAPATRDLQTADTVLQGVPFTIPRGKFDVGFFKDSMQATSKQTSIVIPFSSIQHVLVIDSIPKQPNTTNVVLVMRSNQPVQQGKNLLDLVVVQTKDQPELDIAAPEACQHLGSRLTGAAAVVLSQLLASYIEDIQEDTFLTADSSIFSSSSGELMIAANKGAAPGWLVPLSAGLCYLGKPGRFMTCSSISKVLFYRIGGGSSTFDVTIKLRPRSDGTAAAAAEKPFELGQIDAAELPRLQAYFSAQRIKMGTEDEEEEEEDVGVTGATGTSAADAVNGHGDEDDDDDDDDQDFDPDADDAAEDAGPASKKQRVLAGGVVDDDDSGEGEAESDADDRSGDVSDDDEEESSDVSLIDEDAMSEDDE